MNTMEIRAGLFDALQRVAPEVDPAALASDRGLRSQVDLDSMDWLNFIVGLHERFGVDIPEADYDRLVSVDAIVAYLSARLA
jgi:acyl carrier protein